MMPAARVLGLQCTALRRRESLVFSVLPPFKQHPPSGPPPSPSPSPRPPRINSSPARLTSPRPPSPPPARPIDQQLVFLSYSEWASMKDLEDYVESDYVEE